MKKLLIPLLGIFIIMIIPSSNVFASTGSSTFNVSPKVIWHKYNGGSTDIYTGSSHNLTSADDNISLPYYLSSNNTRVISNENYGLAQIFFSNSNGGFGTCVESCDATITFDWAVSYPNWDTTGRHLANSYFQTLVNTNDIDHSSNLNFSLQVTTLDNQTKDIYCTSDLTYYQTPPAQGPEYDWYYKFHATCNGSNISNVNSARLSVSFWKYLYYTEIGLRFYISNLSYVTGPYTGIYDNTGTNQEIINNIDNVNTNITNVNDSINDDTIDNNFQDSTMNNINSQLASNNVISDLLLLPVTLYQKILNTLSSNTCSPYSLGTLFNTELVLPCVNLQDFLGSTIWTTIDLICSGVFIFGIRKKFVDIFNNMTSLKNRGNELE